MKGAWTSVVAAVAVAVVATVFVGPSEGRVTKSSVEGLLNADDVYNQLVLIDGLVEKLVNESICNKLNLGKDDEDDEAGAAATPGKLKAVTSDEKKKEKKVKKKKKKEEEEAGEEEEQEEQEEQEEKEKEEEEEEKEEEQEEEEKEKEAEEEEKEQEEEEEEEKGKEEEKECDYEEIHVNHTMLLPPNPDCKVHKTGITAEERDLILSLHNTMRAQVALGNETRGDPGPQPAAANMYQLVWNDELAKVAQAWAAQCPSNHDQEPRRRLCSRKYRTGQNINYHWGVLDQGPDWQQATENWYNEVEDVAAEVAASFMPHETKKIGHYTQLVWGTTKEVGCGIVYYETERHGITYTHSITYVCNYGPAGNVLRRPFYEHGPPASNCPGEKSEEYPGLCL